MDTLGDVYERAEVEALVGVRDAPVCRICLDEGGHMIAPCRCRGSTQFVHAACLDAWRAAAPRPQSAVQCDQCAAPYRMHAPHVHALALALLEPRAVCAAFALGLVAAGAAADCLLPAALPAHGIAARFLRCAGVLHRVLLLALGQLRVRAPADVLAPRAVAHAPRGVLEHFVWVLALGLALGGAAGNMCTSVVHAAQQLGDPAQTWSLAGVQLVLATLVGLGGAYGVFARQVRRLALRWLIYSGVVCSYDA